MFSMRNELTGSIVWGSTFGGSSQASQPGQPGQPAKAGDSVRMHIYGVIAFGVSSISLRASRSDAYLRVL